MPVQIISKEDAAIANQLTAPTYTHSVAPEAPDQPGVSMGLLSSLISSVASVVAPEAPDQPGISISVGRGISSQYGPGGGGGGGGGGEGGGGGAPSGGECPALASPCTNPLTGQPSCCCPSGYKADQASWSCIPVSQPGGYPGGYPGAGDTKSFCQQYPTASACQPGYTPPQGMAAPYPGATYCAQYPTAPGCQPAVDPALQAYCAQYPTAPACAQLAAAPGMSTTMMIGLGAAALGLLLLLK